MATNGFVMKGNATMFKARISILGIGLIWLMGGCPGTNPNPAAVLEGNWQINLEQPGDLEGFDIKATFDANGQLTEITAEAPENGGTANLDVSDETTTVVEGSDVTITVPRAAGATTVVNGTLSEDQNTITGAISQELQLPSGDLNVTLPSGNLTLTRIQ